MNCNYCQDTGAVDKDGNIGQDAKSKLLTCPVCKKDGVPKIEVNLETEMAYVKRTKNAWTVKITPKWEPYLVQDFVNYIKINVTNGKGTNPCEYRGQDQDKWHTVEFNGSMRFDMVKSLLRGMPETDYKITFDHMGDK